MATRRVAVVQLDIRHSFPCTPEVFWEMFWDDDFDTRLTRMAAVERHMVSEREEPGVRFWVMRFVPDRELPAPLARLLGSDRLVYNQHNKLTVAENLLEWRVEPAVLADKVTAEGSMRIVATPTGCDRVVNGVVKVAVPLIGGRIEKTILTNVVESYDRAHEAGLEWLATRNVP